MIKPEYMNIPEKEFISIKIFKEDLLNNLYEINKLGEIRKIGSEKILKHNNATGYPSVTLYAKKEKS